MYPVFNINTWQVRAYDVVLVLVLVLSVIALWRLAVKAGFPSRQVALCAVGMALFGLLGGRLNAWLFHLRGGFYWPNLNIFSFRGGATAFGAIAGIFMFGALYAWWRNWNVWRLLDLVVLILPLGEALQRVGCLLNGCCFGKETDSFLGIYLPDTSGRWTDRYPTQILSGIFCLGLAAWLWSRRHHTSFPGELTLLYLVIYGVGRLTLDTMRGDQAVVLGALTAHQLSALLIAIAAGLALLYWQSQHNARSSSAQLPQ